MAIKLSNKGTEMPNRVRLIPKTPGATLTTTDPTKQSLFVDLGDGSYGICISNLKTISCVGATSYVVIPLDLWYGYDEDWATDLGLPFTPVDWDLEVNGTVIGKAAVHGDSSDYIEDIFNDTELGIAGDWNNIPDDMTDYANPDNLWGCLLTSTTLAPKRIRLIPSSNYFNNQDFILSCQQPIETVPNTDPAPHPYPYRADFIRNNPTIEIDQSTGIISFCIEGVYGAGYNVISCAGATNAIVIGTVNTGGIWDITVDGVLYPSIYGHRDYRLDDPNTLINFFASVGIECVFLDINSNPITMQPNGVYIGVEQARLTNISGTDKRILIQTVDASSVDTVYQTEVYGVNESFGADSNLGWAQFCLTAAT